MRTSEKIENISKALLKFHSEVGKISKTSDNPFFKSKYAALPEILEAIRTPLQEAKLIIIQTPTDNYGLTTRLLHESGEWFEDTYFMSPVKNTPQDAGSLITYQRRYALGAILSLNIDEDDDGNKATGNGSKEEKPWLNKGTETFEQAKMALQNETVTLDQIKKKYRISKETEKLLTA